MQQQILRRHQGYTEIVKTAKGNVTRVSRRSVCHAQCAEKAQQQLRRSASMGKSFQNKAQ